MTSSGGVNARGRVLPSNVEQRIATDNDDGERQGQRGQRAIRGALVLVVVLLVLGGVALWLPWPLQRPIWIKAEVVFAAWWLVWAGTLAAMLYGGLTLDCQPTFNDDAARGPRTGWLAYLCNFDFNVGDLGDGVHLVVALVLLVGLVLVVWLVVEVVVPLLIPVGYALVWWLLARVLRASARCKGNVAKSVARGVVWASAYTLPLALCVALAHALV